MQKEDLIKSADIFTKWNDPSVIASLQSPMPRVIKRMSGGSSKQLPTMASKSLPPVPLFTSPSMQHPKPKYANTSTASSVTSNPSENASSSMVKDANHGANNVRLSEGPIHRSDEKTSTQFDNLWLKSPVPKVLSTVLGGSTIDDRYVIKLYATLFSCY